MNAAGIASTDVTVVDVSTVIATGLKGICGIIGATQWGVENSPNTVVGTWTQYVQYYGGLLSYDLNPLLCRRALEAKGSIRVSRVRHYTDITDATTYTGATAELTPAAGAIAEVRASGSLTITTVWATGGDTIAVTLTILGVTTTLGQYVTQANQTPAQVAAAVAAAITAASGTNGGYTAAAVGAVITVTAPAGTGATANTYTLGRVVTLINTSTTVVSAATGFANGVTAVVAHSAHIKAFSYGAWGNLVTVTIAAAANGAAGQVDITPVITGFPQLTKPLTNINQIPSADDLSILNNLSAYVQFDTVSTTGFPIGVWTLVGGDDDYGDIASVDYIGDPTQGIGINAFDAITDIVKIAVPAMCDPLIDAALSAYAVMRGDMISLHRVPVGVNGTTAVAYREGTAPYSHAPIDTWQSFMFMGGLNVNNPTTLVPMNIPELGDMIGVIANQDNIAYEWFCFSGPIRGRIGNCNSVVYNVLTPARVAEASNVVAHGINPVVDHETYGTVSWGNVTLQKAPTLLQKAEVAELCIFVTRAVKPYAQSSLFDPNDVQTWTAIYKRVKKLMDYIQTNRGVWSWVYQGDQNITNISQAIINTSENIDAGQYNFNLWFAPKVGMIYQGVQIGVTNSDVNFAALTGQP